MRGDLTISISITNLYLTFLDLKLVPQRIGIYGQTRWGAGSSQNLFRAAGHGGARTLEGAGPETLNHAGTKNLINALSP